MTSLAFLYSKTGRAAEAEAMNKRVLEKQMEKLGGGHPDTNDISFNTTEAPLIAAALCDSMLIFISIIYPMARVYSNFFWRYDDGGYLGWHPDSSRGVRLTLAFGARGVTEYTLISAAGLTTMYPGSRHITTIGDNLIHPDEPGFFTVHPPEVSGSAHVGGMRVGAHHARQFHRVLPIPPGMGSRFALVIDISFS